MTTSYDDIVWRHRMTTLYYIEISGRPLWFRSSMKDFTLQRQAAAGRNLRKFQTVQIFGQYAKYWYCEITITPYHNTIILYPSLLFFIHVSVTQFHTSKLLQCMRPTDGLPIQSHGSLPLFLFPWASIHSRVRRRCLHVNVLWMPREVVLKTVTFELVQVLPLTVLRCLTLSCACSSSPNETMTAMTKQNAQQITLLQYFCNFLSEALPFKLTRHIGLGKLHASLRSWK